LELYSKQQQEILLGASAGYAAAQQCWAYCDSCSSAGGRASWSDGGRSSSGSPQQLTGSRQTGCLLQSGQQGPRVPPAVSLFVQQCGSGQFTAEQLLQVSSLLPGWMEDARAFMLRLLFAEPAVTDSQQQQQHVQDAPGADHGQQQLCWRLTDTFASLASLSAPGGGLQQLGQTPQALQVCLPAILHVLRGRLLYGSQQQQQHDHEQQAQQQALQLLNEACTIILRLATVLSPQQLQQHLVPLLVSLLAAEHSDAAAEAPAAAAAAACSLAAAAGNNVGSSRASQLLQPPAVMAAVGRRAALQPVLWRLLAEKLPQQVLVSALLPPLLAAMLEPTTDWLSVGSAVPVVSGAAASCVPGSGPAHEEHASHAELSCACVAVLAQKLPFPAVAQHILRPLMLALPAAGSLPTPAAGAVGPAAWAACGLLAVAHGLPKQLTEEFVFRPLLQLALLPLQLAPADRVLHLTGAAMPVLEGLLLHVQAVMKADAVLPQVLLSGQPGAGTGTDAASSSSSGGGSSNSAAHAAIATAAGPPGAASMERSLSVSTASSISTASTAAAAAAAATPADHTPVVWQLADLLLLPPDAQATSASPLLYPRVTALLLVALEAAVVASSSSTVSSPPSSTAGGRTSDNSTTHAASLVTLYQDWVLPRVLQPLLSPAVAAAWQQSPACVKTYWRSVLLLYAGAAHHLGLAAVRAALPDWHSTEVWLLAETGWEPEQQAGDAAAVVPRSSPVLRLLHALAQHGTCASGAQQDDTAHSNASGITQSCGLLGSLESLAAAAAAHSSAHHAALDGILLSQAAGPGGGGGSIAGRVTHLLQRLAEEKVVQRSLHTTHSFLSGVGWSLPRPASPSSAGSNSGGQQGVASMLPPSPLSVAPDQPRRRSSESVRPESHATAAAHKVQRGGSSDDFAVSLRASSATTSNSGAQQQQHPVNGSMQRAESAPAKSAAGAQRIRPSSAQQQQQQQRENRRSTQSTAAPPAAASGSGSAPVRGRDWFSELQQLRHLLDSPARPVSGEGWVVSQCCGHSGWMHPLLARCAAEHGHVELTPLPSLRCTVLAVDRGPSAGKEWFWLLQNRKLTPSHLVPCFTPASPSVAGDGSSGSSSSGHYHGTWHSSDAAGSSSSWRPWRARQSMWWSEGWSLGAVCLHSWPAHRERLRALAADPWERFLVTAGGCWRG
jgi:hypothetical protein